jgi:YidC/Oxa1 family membrane protein insertase
VRLVLISAGLLLIGLLRAGPATAEIAVETDFLNLQFNESGDLLRVEACFPNCSDSNSKRRVLSSGQGMLTLAPADTQVLRFERRHIQGTTVLEFAGPAETVIHRWRIPDQGWLVSLESSAGEAALASGQDFRPPPSSGFGYLLEQTRYNIFDDGSVRSIGLGETEHDIATVDDWFGFRNRFWTAMVWPENRVPLVLETGESTRDARIVIGQDLSGQGLALSLYIGPVEPAALAGAAPELTDLMYSGLWFWLRWICQGMYHLLNLIAMAVPHWGLAVMLLSLSVGILMRPLSKLADRLQGQVHETDARLGPILAEIKKNHKGAEQSEKVIAMYKEHGVHPLYSLKSLAGVAVVIPIFIGAFDMLAENIHLSGESFLWMADLSQPDMFWKMPIRIPFFGEYLNLLPFIMTGLSIVASKRHGHPAMDSGQQRKQARNLVAMAMGFLILFYTFPAGMVLYWTANNLISVLKTLAKKR